MDSNKVSELDPTTKGRWMVQKFSGLKYAQLFYVWLIKTYIIINYKLLGMHWLTHWLKNDASNTNICYFTLLNSGMNESQDSKLVVSLNKYPSEVSFRSFVFSI